MGSDSPSTRVERAIGSAREARIDGSPEEALRRLTGAAALLGAGRVERHLAVDLCRERGLCHVALNAPGEAWQAFDDGLEFAGQQGALSDPLIAAEVTLDLMMGNIPRAQNRLATGDQTRRASLVAQARLHLLLGRLELADATLQACEQAPGGASDLSPPSAVLRSLIGLWQGRPEQARMLYDGVGTPNNPHWELVRVLVLRAQWVATGDARYLSLALGSAEELRFLTTHATTPGLHAASCAHHAILLTFSGQLALAVEAMDEGLAALGTMSLPEWPRAAVLHDLAVVARDTGASERLQRTLSLAAEEDTDCWLERLRMVTGPRSDGALVPSARPVQRVSDPAPSLAMAVLSNRDRPCTGLLRGVSEAIGAHGARWLDANGQEVAALGAAWTPDDNDSAVSVETPSGQTFLFRGAGPKDLAGLSLDELDTLARHAENLARDRRASHALRAEIERVEASRRRAHTTLERTRRGPVAVTMGGTFPTVAGRSERIAQALDQLALLAKTEIPVLVVGPQGAGRRHLARAFAGLISGVHGQTPVIDVSVVPSELLEQTIDEIIASPRHEALILANAEGLTATLTSRLLGELSDGTFTRRLIVTLDEEDEGLVARTWRESLCAGRVRLAGLDERTEDLPLLIDAMASAAGLRSNQLDDDIRAMLMRRDWPMHCAEIRGVLVDAAVLCGDGPVLPEHLSLAKPGRDNGLSRGLDLGYHEAIKGFRRDLLRYALEKTEGNRTRAAKLLGVQRTYFMRLIRDLRADDIPPAA